MDAEMERTRAGREHGSLESVSLGDAQAMGDERVVGGETLDMRRQKDVNMAAVGRMTSLATLDLAGTGLVVGGALAGLTCLQELRVASCRGVDVKAVGRMTSLTSLDLSHTALVDVGALAGLTSLQRLRVAWCGGVDLNAVGKMTSLTYLDLTDTGVVDVGALAGLTRLQELHIMNCSSLRQLPTCLTRLESLTELEASGCRLISPPQAFVDRHPWHIIRLYLQCSLATGQTEAGTAFRLMLVGDGGAGKTTLAKALVAAGKAEQLAADSNDSAREAYDASKPNLAADESTHGLEEWVVEGKDGRRLQVVDFAGQLEYLPLHELLFAGMHTIYMVVCRTWGRVGSDGAVKDERLTTKEVQERCMYWMQKVHSSMRPEYRLGGGRVVLAESEEAVCSAFRLALTHMDKAKDFHHGLMFEYLQDALAEAKLPQVADGCHLVDHTYDSAMAVLKEVMGEAERLGRQLQYPWPCAVLQDVVEHMLAKGKAADQPPMVLVEDVQGQFEELMVERRELGSNGSEEASGIGEGDAALFEMALGVLEALGEVAVAGKVAVLRPLGWLAGVVCMFVLRQDSRRQTCRKYKEDMWEGYEEPRGWVEEKAVRWQLGRHHHCNEDQQQQTAVEVLHQFGICYRHGDRLVFPCRLHLPAWGRCEMLSGMYEMAGQGRHERRLRVLGAAVWGKGGRVPEGLFSRLQVGLAGRSEVEVKDVNILQMLVLWRSTTVENVLVMLEWEAEEEEVRVVAIGLQPRPVVDEILEELDRLCQRAYGWMDGVVRVICGHCLQHCVEQQDALGQLTVLPLSLSPKNGNSFQLHGPSVSCEKRGLLAGCLPEELVDQSAGDGVVLDGVTGCGGQEGGERVQAGRGDGASVTVKWSEAVLAVKNAVALVRFVKRPSMGFGSGFLFRMPGTNQIWLMTCVHVLAYKKDKLVSKERLQQGQCEAVVGHVADGQRAHVLGIEEVVEVKLKASDSSRKLDCVVARLSKTQDELGQLIESGTLAAVSLRKERYDIGKVALLHHGAGGTMGKSFSSRVGGVAGTHLLAHGCHAKGGSSGAPLLGPREGGGVYAVGLHRAKDLQREQDLLATSMHSIVQALEQMKLVIQACDEVA